MIKRVVLIVALLMASAEATAGQHRPESFGAVVGAGQSAEVRAANYTAMKACVDSAAAANVSISLPAATIEIDVPNNGSSASSTLKIKRDLQIIGADRRLSKLMFGPEAPTYGYSGFYAGPNTRVLFKNCTIEGPNDPGPKTKFNCLTYAILQTGLSYTSTGGRVYDTPGELRLDNVTIAGEWYTSIQGAHGDVPLVLINCDITGYTQCVTWSASFNAGKKLYAKNTYFHDAGLPGKGHLIYLSPCVSFEIDNCRFAGNFRYAIHHYGSARLAPKFARLSNSKFESTCADGIETTSTGLTEITNCTFETTRRAIALKGDTTIQGCTFNNGTGVTTYDIHSGVRVNISGSKFNGGGVITSVWRDCEWRITECEFVGKGSGSIAIANGAAGTQVHVDNCRFSGTWTRGIRISGGSYFVTNCSFAGTYAEAAIVYDDSKGEVDLLKVDNCTFKDAGRSLWAQSGASGKVTGSGNYFAARMPEVKLVRGDSAASAPDAGPGMYQKLELRKGRSPDRLTSAATLQPSFNYDSYRVSGTARINSIKLGGSDEVNRMCAGRLELVADGAWSLGEGGNIKPIATGARRVGEVVTLVHHPDAGFWVEVKNETRSRL
jgi:hypothetical protein